MLVRTDFFKPGSLLASRYEVVELLGAGGMGWVLRVRDRRFEGQELALKLLYPHVMKTDQAFLRFRSEVSITRKMSHPAIVQTFGFGRAERGLPYVAMEYVPGRTLKSAVLQARGELSFEEMASILMQTAAGLRFAHAKGIIHRDIKPENVLLREDGIVKLADFGLAQVFREESNLTKTGTVIGTPFYMSPEQIRGEALSKQSDIYSFGILAYELAAGAPPFQGETLYMLAEQHLTKALPPLPQQNTARPEWLPSFLARCTAKDPSARFSSMDEVSVFLAANIPSLAQTAVPASIVTGIAADTLREARFGSMRRWTGVIIIASLLLGYAGAAIGFSRQNGDVNWRLAAVLYGIERDYGWEFPRLKALLSIKGSHNASDSFFTDLPTETIIPLLAAGMDPNVRDKATGSSIIHRLLVTNEDGDGIAEKIAAAVEKGCDVNAADNEGNTALHMAVKAANSAAVSILLAWGADSRLADKRGWTPLATAVNFKMEAVARQLLLYSADPNKEIIDGRRPLHLAAEKCNAYLTRALLLHHADPLPADAEGRTPAMIAQARLAEEPGCAGVLAEIKKSRARNRHLSQTEAGSSARQSSVQYGAGE